MFMQAWGNYGTAWAVVHQWLGVQPDLGREVVDFVPQVPQGQTSVEGQNIRLGGGSDKTESVFSGEITLCTGVFCNHGATHRQKSCSASRHPPCAARHTADSRAGSGP